MWPHQNKFIRGREQEKVISRTFHQQGIPLLVSPLVLRASGCGQIDLARLEKTKERKGWKICLVEIKTHHSLSSHQKARLKKSGLFLGNLFGYPIEQKYEMLKGEGGSQGQ